MPCDGCSILGLGQAELHSLSGTDTLVLLPRGRAGEKVPEGRMRGPRASTVDFRHLRITATELWNSLVQTPQHGQVQIR